MGFNTLGKTVEQELKDIHTKLDSILDILYKSTQPPEFAGRRGEDILNQVVEDFCDEKDYEEDRDSHHYSYTSNNKFTGDKDKRAIKRR